MDMLDYDKFSEEFTDLLLQYDADALEKWIKFDDDRTIENNVYCPILLNIKDGVDIEHTHRQK